MSTAIVVEERLRTRVITTALIGVAVLLVGIEVLVVTVVAHQVTWIVWLVFAGAFLLLLIAGVVFSRVIVRVLDDAAGRSLGVLYGPGALVRQRFASYEIETASAQRFSILQLGGWGYRGSLRFMKSAAVATRAGDALVVSLSRGRRFIITVDEPEAFVEGLAKPTTTSV